MSFCHTHLQQNLQCPLQRLAQHPSLLLWCCLYAATSDMMLRVQAGLLLLQLLWSSDKKTQAKRAEVLKAEVLEVSARILAQPADKRAVPAAALLALFAASSEAERESILSARPSVLGSTQRLLCAPSPTLVATTCSLLRALATAGDSRPRLLKAFKEADWRPLLAACAMSVCSYFVFAAFDVQHMMPLHMQAMHLFTHLRLCTLCVYM